MPIVYDGSRGSSHGDLFTGLKLFIFHRVPQRERWIDLVQGNGGEVVKLESQADMLIADHVKRGGAAPPPGSYSWQWIEYSVKNGYLEHKDDYRIEEAPARTAGTSAPTKGKRVPFTSNDDDILMKFVVGHERQGNAISGNVIFKILEEQPGPSNTQSTPSRSPMSTPKKQERRHGRNLFTKEDDKLLLEMIRKTLEFNKAAAAEGKSGKRLSGNKIYQEFAEEKKEQVGKTIQLRSRNRNRGQTEMKRLGHRLREYRLRHQQRCRHQHSVQHNHQMRDPTARGSRDSNRAREELALRNCFNELGEVTSSDETSLEDDQDEDTEQYEDAQEGLSQEVDGNDSSSRDQFYDDLQDYLEVSGAEIQHRPVVAGREIELWDLFTAVTQQDCAVEDRDWTNVAQRLGFDWTKSATCAENLRACYNRNLADFEEAIGPYDDQDDTSVVDDEHVAHDEELVLPQTSDAVTAPKEPYAAPSSPPYRSSSPIAGLKRSFQQSNASQSELGYPSDGSRKRRRRDYGKVIPPTPDRELRFTGESSSRAEAQGFSSPSNHREAAPRPNNVYAADDAEDFLNTGMHDIEEVDELPELAPSKKKRFLEPETQDFGLAMGGDEHVRQTIERSNTGYFTDEDDNTPSQQLLSELDAFSSPAPPVSRTGNGTAPANRPPFVEPRPRPFGGPAQMTHTSASRTATITGSNVVATSASASSLKATKRSLPQHYQRQPPAPAAIRNGIAVPQSHPMSPIADRTAAVAPKDVNQRSRQSVPSTPTRAALPSTQLRRPSARVYTSPTLAPKQSHSQDPAQPVDFGKEYVDAQFEHFLALGYDTRQIGQAMEAASLHRGPMTVALQSLDSGKGIPRDAPGVWTDDDDEKLRKVRDYDRRAKMDASSSGSNEDPREKARVERFRKFLAMKHDEWVGVRLRFMDVMDKGPDA
ncbi:hypothetical protein J7T55_013781 [Diaporthe amygdali]|uniref:uncharacterized protein n=1 Tax=Phomopsis amygdali TaxID=1214568 RepID=UPI0022FE7D63|nr:uncharacterized protein J7T55_013781 [Diaporthe amygdali]KAJ0119578.1 hypothetical protein J7T55_013781 [Diaporthe amygdali]